VTDDGRVHPNHVDPAVIDSELGAHLPAVMAAPERPLTLANLAARRAFAAAGIPSAGPGAYHGFEARVPDAELSLAARAARTAWLRRVLRLG
jgi:hypothetical protein